MFIFVYTATTIRSLIHTFDKPQIAMQFLPNTPRSRREERQSNDLSLMQNAASINANKQEGRIDKKESLLSISKAVVTLPDS